MNFAELKTELADRGFSDLTDTRRGRYINAARAELDRMYNWPWREKSVTGTAPLSIADLGPIELVTNQSQGDYRLQASNYSDLSEEFGDLSTTGTPEWYYRASPSGTPAIATYPTSTDTIGVQYWKTTVDLTGTDTPASPADVHYLIVDLAARRAYRDTDAHQQAEVMRSEIDLQINELLQQYPPGVADDAGYYLPLSGTD